MSAQDREPRSTYESGRVRRGRAQGGQAAPFVTRVIAEMSQVGRGLTSQQSGQSRDEPEAAGGPVRWRPAPAAVAPGHQDAARVPSLHFAAGGADTSALHRRRRRDTNGKPGVAYNAQCEHSDLSAFQ